MFFRGQYDFLSNFYPCEIEMEGQRFKSVEAAFQAAKTLDPTERKRFTHLSPSEAKREGRKVKIRKDWNEVRIRIMGELVTQKFVRNENLRVRLMNVKGEIAEDNTWGDTFWGKVNGVGQNNLGKILMLVRDFFLRQ